MRMGRLGLVKAGLNNDGSDNPNEERLFTVKGVQREYVAPPTQTPTNTPTPAPSETLTNTPSPTKTVSPTPDATPTPTPLAKFKQFLANIQKRFSRAVSGW